MNVIDPQVKVLGLQVNVQTARELILNDLDTKSSRVTLKIDIPFSEHSHVIGKEGANIKKGNPCYMYNYRYACEIAIV